MMNKEWKLLALMVASVCLSAMISRGYAQQYQQYVPPSTNTVSNLAFVTPKIETDLPTPKKASVSTQAPKAAPKPLKPGVTPAAPQLSLNPPSAEQPHHRSVIYPWKANIITTVFGVGELGSTVSPTTNLDSAWVTDWCSAYGGKDSLEDRRGLLPRHHAALLNPFYIALPFNDLAFPEKAREWLPPGWIKSTKRGEKPVSACKDRWVEIRNAQGRSCFAQWEDVGPLRYDHAEYVFGDERPTTYSRAGLDVSPAVATYLGIDGNNRITAWRFVEAEDVPPGDWLKYNEEAVILLALRQDNNIRMPSLESITGGDKQQQQPANTTANSSSDDSSENKKKAQNAKG